MSILIVDDSDDQRILIKQYLNDAGYKDVLLADSAESAFNILRLNDPSGPDLVVDLILMDIVMPGMDGIKACHAIRKNIHFEDIPIIMVSVLDDIKNLQKSFAAGVVDYIAKPVNKIEMVIRVRSMLRFKYEIDRRKSREKELIEMTQHLETLNEMLEHLSYFDTLTGIPNRRYFEKFIDAEWKRAIRNERPLSLIFLDIDNFKDVNDKFGHQTGDKCLKKAAKAISQSLRRPGDFLARYGGEEFIIVLSDTEREGAKSVAENVRSKVAEVNVILKNSDTKIAFTISAGVSTTIPERNSSYQALINMADQALYKAKKGGKNRVAVVSVK